MESNSTYASNLKDQLRDIESRFIVVLQGGHYGRYEKPANPWSGGPPRIAYRWSKLTPDLERTQNQLVMEFDQWHSSFLVLFQNATQDEQTLLQKLYFDMNAWIKYRTTPNEATSTNQAVTSFQKTCDQFVQLLDNLAPSGSARPIFVIDTNALIDCPDVSRLFLLLGVTGAIMIIPSTALQELDDLKSSNRDPNFRSRLTKAIRGLKEARNKGDVLVGVSLPNGSTLKMLATEPNFSHLPKWLDQTNKDDRILAAAIELQTKNPLSPLTIITNDINMQNKASLARIPTREIPEVPDDTL